MAGKLCGLAFARVGTAFSRAEHPVNEDLQHNWKRLRKKCFHAGRVSSAAEAGVENKSVIAAMNRCAAQNQVQRRVFPQPVEVVLFHLTIHTEFFRDSLLWSLNQ